MPRKRALVWLVAFVLIFPSAASADVGLPMLFLVWPGMVAALIPIIVLEAIVAKRLLSLPWLTSLKLSAAANIVSTLLGVPISWISALMAQFLIAITFMIAMPSDTDFTAVQKYPYLMLLWSAWLPPPVERSMWIVPLAAAVLCIPLCLASVWIEAKIGCRMIGADRRTEVYQWSWRANLLSYSVLIALMLVFSAWIAFCA